MLNLICCAVVVAIITHDTVNCKIVCAKLNVLIVVTLAITANLCRNFVLSEVNTLDYQPFLLHLPKFAYLNSLCQLVNRIIVFWVLCAVFGGVGWEVDPKGYNSNFVPRPETRLVFLTSGSFCGSKTPRGAPDSQSTSTATSSSSNTHKGTVVNITFNNCNNVTYSPTEYKS